MVQGLITATVSTGLILQILGSFGGTIDLNHLADGKAPSDYKLGQKVKARVLYDVAGSSPPQFALSLKDHVKNLKPPKDESSSTAIVERFPVGTMLIAVKVKRVEPERGLFVEVEPGLEGFVHVSLLLIDARISFNIEFPSLDIDHLR